jgi:acyl-coenzyme A synthetase/AMP-(fatty) acid ligase/pimeloyl-ACP methyl ester carboxylesterase
VTLPPPGLPGLDPRWSHEVTGTDSTGVTRTWHVLDSGDGSAGTLLCVHGNPSWSYLWRRLVAAPPPGWRVVAVDQLDMGFSERTGTVRRLAQRIDDLDSLTAAMGLTGPVITVAHDWGGPISLGWALRHTDQLAGVVLANTGVHQPDESRAPTVIRAARTPGVLTAVTQQTRNFIRGGLFFSRPVPPADVRAAFYAPYATAARRAAIADFVRDIPLEADHPSAQTLDGIADGLAELAQTPVLLMWGPRDPVFSDVYLRDLIGRLPHADVHRYEGSSHFVPEDAPTFAGDVARWVGDLAAPVPDTATAEIAAALPDTDALPLWGAVARRRGDSTPAVIEMGPDGPTNTTSFDELHHRIENVAAGLAAIGVAAGDRIALLVPPGADLTAVLYGIWRRGAVAVVVDAGLGLRGIRTALRSAGPKYVVAVPKGLAATRTMGLAAEGIVVGRLSAALRRTLTVSFSLAEVEKIGEDSPLPDPPGAADAAAIAFTSGATGPAKGVLYLHRQLHAQRESLTRLYGITQDDRLVAAFGPFALFGAALGIPSAVPDMDLTAPRTLSAAALADAVAAVRATLVFASPAALTNVARTRAAVADARREALKEVRLLLSTGAPVPAGLLRDVLQLLPSADAHAPYGMTEVLPVADISVSQLEAAGTGNGTCVGTPVPGVTVAISPLDALGRAVGPRTDAVGVTGEVCVRAPHTKQRYDRLWVTERAASRDPGWHRTGDVGHFDAAGRLWIEGRLVHVISTAAGPVTPLGLERLAQAVAGVTRAAAVGVGPTGVQQVVVVVEGQGRAGLAPDWLRDAVRASLTSTGVSVAAVLTVRSLPVDIRHNSKIDRARVGRWAGRVLAGGRVGAP